MGTKKNPVHDVNRASTLNKMGLSLILTLVFMQLAQSVQIPNRAETSADMENTSGDITEARGSISAENGDSVQDTVTAGDVQAGDVATASIAYSSLGYPSGGQVKFTTTQSFIRKITFSHLSDLTDEIYGTPKKKKKMDETYEPSQPVENILPPGVCQVNRECRSEDRANDASQASAWYHTIYSASVQGACFALECFPCVCKSCSMGLCCPWENHEASAEDGYSTGCTNDKFTAVVRCPRDWPQADGLAVSCENSEGRFTDEEPVTDILTNTTFRNKYCAECHGVQQYVSWEKLVFCRHFQVVYTAESEDEFLEKAASTSSCSVKSAPPVGVTTHFCPGFSWFRRTIISSCNVTGRWEHFDDSVERNCLRHRALSFRVRPTESETNLVFQNIYCAVCNGIHPGPVRCPPPFEDGHIPGRPFVALTFLLSLRIHQGQERHRRRDQPLGIQNNSRCPEDGWIDLSGTCRKVSCTPGKRLDGDNSTCRSALPRIRGLFYALDITLAPQAQCKLRDEQDVWEDFWEGLSELFRSKIPGKVRQYNISFYLFVNRTDGPEILVEQMRVIGKFQSSENIGRDDFENQAIAFLMASDWNVTDLENKTVSFTYVHPKLPDQTEPANTSEILRWTTNSYFMRSISEELLTPLTPTLVCPYIEFGASEFHVSPDLKSGYSFKIVLKSDAWEVKLPNAEQVDFVNGSLRVCVQQLHSLHSPFSNQALIEFSVWQYILNVVSFSMSILCLLIVLLVFALLPELRTQPGWNTIGTCITLLCAQMSLLLASHQVFSGLWCSVLGIVVHMSWLSTFCWTTVSSVHMFRTFSCKSLSRKAQGSATYVVKNIALTTAVPMMVVTVVMMVSHFTSDGKSLGYSSTKCYLASAWLVGFTVVMPLAMIILINTALFILTVRHIHNVVSMQTENETEHESQQVKACLRLSLLTGITWVLSLVAEGFELDWLRAISIVTNGGQGALLLLSYVTTRRVFSLLAVRLGCVKGTVGKPVVTKSKTGSSDSVRKSSIEHSSDAVVFSVQAAPVTLVKVAGNEDKP